MEEIIERIESANGLAYAETERVISGFKISGDVGDNIEFYMMFTVNHAFEGGVFTDYDNSENTQSIKSVDHLIELISE